MARVDVSTARVWGRRRLLRHLRRRPLDPAPAGPLYLLPCSLPGSSNYHCTILKTAKQALFWRQIGLKKQKD